MNNRLIANLSLVVAMVVLLVVLRDTWAKPQSAFDQIDLLVDTRYQLASEYVDEPDPQKLIEGAINGMVEALDDPYTAYLPPETFNDFEESVRGEFEGIGAEVTIENNRLHIVTPLEDSPAYKAGVMAGDTVLEIDGTDTLDMSITDAIKLLKGPADTDVTIKVRHEDGGEADITVTRAQIKVRTVRGFTRDAEGHYSYMLDPDSKIGYVRLTQFSERTADELEEVLTDLKDEGMKGLILDVRFNPGGLLDAAVRISDMFLGEGSGIVSVRGRAVQDRSYDATDDTLLPDTPVVILANSFSASASEILAGALEDNDRALFVGERTFGKGSVQQVKMLDGAAGALKLTNAYYYLPSGRNIHRRNKAEGEPWGVDPSDGAYVRMNADERRAMIEARRDQDLIQPENGEAKPEVTPAFVRETLADKQLAAAFEAVLGKLETGDWPTVGESNADALVRIAEQEQLEKQRELLEEGLAEVNQKLAALEGKPVGDAAEGAAGTILEVEGGPVDEMTDDDTVLPAPELAPAE